MDEGESEGEGERGKARTSESEDARDQLFGSDVSDYITSDVDGDGDADLIELHDPEEGSTEIGFEVWISDGSAFADAASWGSMDCASECEDLFTFVR